MLKYRIVYPPVVVSIIAHTAQKVKKFIKRGGQGLGHRIGQSHTREFYSGTREFCRMVFANGFWEILLDKLYGLSTIKDVL
jgi:hypothetical protein